MGYEPPGIPHTQAQAPCPDPEDAGDDPHAQRFGELQRVWRGLLSLAGQPVPADSLPLLQAVAAQYELDRGVLDQLRAVQDGTRSPEFDELGRLADALDRLLATVTATVDGLEPGVG